MPLESAASREVQEGVKRWLLPTLLFFCTLFSTLLVGGMWAGEPYDVFDLPLLLAAPELLWRQLAAGLPFALTLLGILGAHEFGHFFAAKAHRVPCSPPYFLPFPSLLGTLGAVIRMRGHMPQRKALVDIAAAGPLAGLVIALPALALGLGWSIIAPLPKHQPLPSSLVGIISTAFSSEGLPESSGMYLEGSSLLYLFMRWLICGPLPPGHDLYLHPVALAAWFGLFVTALNLVPIGQLDGGHLAYALWGRKARWLGRLLILLLAALGLFAWAGWLLWAVLGLFFFRTGHPPTLNDSEVLPRSRWLICWICLAFFILCIVPVPLRQI